MTVSNDGLITLAWSASVIGSGASPTPFLLPLFGEGLHIFEEITRFVCILFLSASTVPNIVWMVSNKCGGWLKGELPNELVQLQSVVTQ